MIAATYRSSNRARSVFHWIAVCFVTMDALYRMWRMFSEGARLIDWAILVVDFLVLAVILWLDAPERFHKRQVRKRLVIVQGMMLDGHGLKNSVAHANENDEAASSWINNVQTWMHTSYQTLADVSMPGALAFIHRNVSPDIFYGGVTNRQDVSKQFQELLIRLENLQNIMEKADVYF